MTGVYNLTNSGSADALIAFRDNITNFDEVATSRGIEGWNDTEATQSELCTWTGVLCGGASNNLLLGLNLPGYGFEGEPVSVDCSRLAACGRQLMEHCMLCVELVLLPVAGSRWNSAARCVWGLQHSGPGRAGSKSAAGHAGHSKRGQ